MRIQQRSDSVSVLLRDVAEDSDFQKKTDLSDATQTDASLHNHAVRQRVSASYIIQFKESSFMSGVFLVVRVICIKIQI